MRFTSFLLALTALVCAAPATAQSIYTPTGNTQAGAPTLAFPRVPYIPNQAFEGAYDMTSATTVSSTTAVNLPGLSFTIPAVVAGDYTRRFLRVCYNADVTKATAGTGAIQVAQDGVLWQTSPRYAAFGSRETISGCFLMSRITPLAPTTITIQAVSSDTNTFTVTNAQAYVIGTAMNQ